MSFYSFMECYRNLDQSGSCTITCQMQKINTFCYHKYDAVDKLITKHLKCSGHVIMLLELYRSLRFMVLFSRCKAGSSVLVLINRQLRNSTEGETIRARESIAANRT